MKKSILKEYAKLIVNVGANVQKGQEVNIVAEIEQADFVMMLVQAAYKRKAKRVIVDWVDDRLTKLTNKYQSVKTLGEVLDWQKAKFEHQVNVLPVKIYIESSDPDGEKGIDQKKRAEATKLRYPVIKPYIDKMEDRYQWVIAAAAGTAWAKKLFPDLPAKQAKEKLWIEILKASRALEGNPVENWNEHNARLDAHAKFLNNLDLVELRYKAGNGTDFKVGLIPGARFLAGGEHTIGGTFFNPNIPTEECFTTPMKGKAEGIVYASKPLSYNGEVIDKFWIRFKDGKAVEFGAEQNEALLKEMLNMDETAGYLGEIALVPKESPINRSGILFFNTLFDENASCHVALGRGFNMVLPGFENMTFEEIKEKGVNDSLIHVDFMIGTDDMSIVGITRDGREISVFKNGTWAF
jgi:aminopeptidase